MTSICSSTLSFFCGIAWCYGGRFPISYFSNFSKLQNTLDTIRHLYVAYLEPLLIMVRRLFNSFSFLHGYHYAGGWREGTIPRLLY